MIVSRQNPKVQRVRALLGRRKEREEQRAFVLEGVRLIEEAMNAGASPELVLHAAGSPRFDAAVERAGRLGAEVLDAAPDLLESLSDTQASQGILAVFPLRPLPIPAHLDFVLVLDAISDPGNLGAILRAAAAAGVQLAILAPETTDAYAPKVVRAAMGAHFYLPVHAMTWDEIERLAHQPQARLQVLASDAAGGASCWDSDFRQPLALVIGSEATGITPAARRLANSFIHIPMQGKIESLNASIAAGILLFEVIRQRRS